MFSKTKAAANAQTSFKNTSYYFSSFSENFNESLKVLLEFTQTPYFTKENVEKERGIIEQEIKMYEDSPEWVCFFNCLQGMFLKSAVKEKISGSVSSIAKIDKELLYSCYNSFYCPSNMALVVAGNFNKDEVLNLIEEKFRIKNIFKIQKQKQSEPEEVKSRYVESIMPILNPIFNIGFKLRQRQGEELFKLKIGLEILTELLFKEGSKLCEEFYETKLVFGGEIEAEVLYGNDYFALILSGESYDPKKVLEYVFKEIEYRKKEGFEEEEFLSVKKTIYKNIIKSFSTPEKMANFLTESYLDDFLLLDPLDAVANFTLCDLKNTLKQLDLNKTTFSVVWPKNKERK